MVKVGLLVFLEAKPGKEHDLAAFLRAGLPLAKAEPATGGVVRLSTEPKHVRHRRRVRR